MQIMNTIMSLVQALVVELLVRQAQAIKPPSPGETGEATGSRTNNRAVVPMAVSRTCEERTGITTIAKEGKAEAPKSVTMPHLTSRRWAQQIT